MDGRFDELGLRAELVTAAETAGYDAPTALQRAAIPVLRRGGNAVLHASAGAGLVAAYGLALLDRLADGAPEADARPRALVLVPTPESASRTGASLARLAGAVAVQVAAAAPGWPRTAGTADIVVATPATALADVHAARLKLAGVQTLVLDGLAALFEFGAQEAIETLTTSIPRESQRVVATAEATADVESYIERHVRRALRIPAGRAEGPAEPERTIEYAVAPESAKLDTLAILLADREPTAETVVCCRNAERAAAVADALALRGFPAGTPGAGTPITVTPPAPAGGDAAPVISYDVPFDAETLAARHAGGGGIVLVSPRELPHLRTIAGRAGIGLVARTPERIPTPARDEIAAFRTRLRRALVEEDIGAQILVLEPLLGEFSAAEVAAAASALLRRRAPAPEPPAAPAGIAPPPPPFVRLFVGIGHRDGVRPGDLVGAITGEANVPGSDVGRIEIRDNFSIVEVASASAGRIIEALNGVTLKGRSLRVDYDRRPTTGGGGARAGERGRRRPTP
ncbi:MAG TPA: DEAD/DEAH box helicase [Longimicrobiales bacterium]